MIAHIEGDACLFTAVQAAKKILMDIINNIYEFTAVQAAKKL